MTDEELAEIEARAAAATPGPWHPRLRQDAVNGLHYAVYGVDWEHNPLGAVWRYEADTDPADDQRNAYFIAAARVDIPALVAEVRRLRAEVETARAEEREACARIAGDTKWELGNFIYRSIAAEIRARGEGR